MSVGGQAGAGAGSGENVGSASPGSRSCVWRRRPVPHLPTPSIEVNEVLLSVCTAIRRVHPLLRASAVRRTLSVKASLPSQWSQAGHHSPTPRLDPTACVLQLDLLPASCVLRTASTYCLLPTAYCLLPTTYCLLPTTYCLPPTAYCLLPTAYCLLSTANYPLTVFHYLLSTTYYLLPTAHYLLPTTNFLLPTSYYLLSTAY